MALADLRHLLHLPVRSPYCLADMARNAQAHVCSASMGEMIAQRLAITAPTRTVHGLDDPLVPVASGQQLAQHNAGARTDFIPGMGHDLPEPLLGHFATGIAENAARAHP